MEELLLGGGPTVDDAGDTALAEHGDAVGQGQRLDPAAFFRLAGAEPARHVGEKFAGADRRAAGDAGHQRQNTGLLNHTTPDI